jgi:hypothetical protein
MIPGEASAAVDAINRHEAAVAAAVAALAESRRLHEELGLVPMTDDSIVRVVLQAAGSAP